MKYAILATFSGLLMLSSCSKNDALTPQVANTVSVANVPQIVLSSMSKNFPSATQTTWTQTAPTAYMASFSQGNARKTATFQNNGVFLKTGDVIDPAILPTAITDYLKANYAGYAIVQADVKKDASGLVKGYEALITVGTAQYELEFDAAGKFTKLETPNGHDQGTGIAESTLLAAITSYLKANYVSYTFKEAESRMANGVLSGYKVEIVQNNTQYHLNFDVAGAFVSVNTGGKGDSEGKGSADSDNNHNDTVIAQKDLPASVTAYLDATYKGYAFVSAVVEKDKVGVITGYEVKFTLIAKNYEAEFDASGKLLKLD
ncbi:PepSY-like domain-containing protein [Runella sp. MFBS21]|uniref:PepSY-like domain-containing protein n=1 Tax=Runella sp. MFBS21 TaxID=3034018 RepID=UPI0023F8B314|nr:PepSY-like domain-containing protein [Runella sp. MFBS21]MCA0233129.1 PepSY-like domain-containing protein [Bacteroidota bacterium]MDF7821253.1 PepSY-like domain-containing protein [Runella sp. MFBS21]